MTDDDEKISHSAKLRTSERHHFDIYLLRNRKFRRLSQNSIDTQLALFIPYSIEIIYSLPVDLRSTIYKLLMETIV